MFLRIVLSLAMLAPAAPARAESGKCPFTTIEECRAWLEECCGAESRDDDLCLIIECDADKACGVETDLGCTGFVCCKVQYPLELEPTRKIRSDNCEETSHSSCCSSTLECPPPEVDAGPSPPEPERTCAEHFLPDQGMPPCDWCCCCPIAPIRVPEPPQTPVTQRPSTENTKFEVASTETRIAVVIVDTARPDHQFLELPLPSNDRQSVLCVWRE